VLASSSNRHRAPSWSAATLTLVSCLVLLVVPACGKKGGNEDEVKAPEVPTISAQVGKVTRQSIARVLTLRGTIATAPNQDVKISSLVPGRVIDMPVAEGDTVRQGQTVAQIDRRPLEDQQRQAAAALQQAKAVLEAARSNLERTQHLFERGITARKEVEDAQSQMAVGQSGVEQATAALDIAARNVERANVTTPIAGQVVKRLIAVGEQVDGTAAQPLVEVANLAAVELGANIPAEYLASVRVGLPVTIVSDTFPDRTFEGRVVAVSPAVDPASNSALGRILIRNADGLLRVGMFAQARIPTDEHADALVVPAAAITREQGNAFLYVVNGAVAERKPVKLGIETPEAVEVLEGVTEGQQVLTSNIHGLGEKAKLQQGQGS
jgi:RND family efflux transporter MFP subunit